MKYRRLSYATQKPRSQGFLSCFEKEPWLRLVTWKCVSVNCTAAVSPPLNFVNRTMKKYLGYEKILAWKWRLSYWVGCKLCCFRLVTITLFWRQNRILFREFVLEKRFGRRPANRIRKIYLDLHVQNQLFVKLHTSQVYIITTQTTV